MKYIGIDIAAETHVAAILDDAGTVLRKPFSFGEDAEGYAKLREALGASDDALVVMEATGHYWQNVFAMLTSEGFHIALVNPLRTKNFAAEDLRRAKTDGLDALSIARMAQQKRLEATVVPDEATRELRELVRLRDRLVQDLGDRTRQLHRVVDLSFPEFTRHVRDLSSELATTILAKYPTAKQLRVVKIETLAKLVYDGRHTVGRQLAETLREAAKTSVGAHDSNAYQLQSRYACEDIATLRARIKTLERDIHDTLDRHEIGKLLTTIDGIGPTTAARLVAELGDIAGFRSGDAVAAYVGVVPGTHQSGKRTPSRAAICSIGHAKLRAKLWMPTLVAVRHNAWLKAFYDRLVAAGKTAKLALIAAMRKLLTAVYSVAKNRRAFVPKVPVTEETTT